MHVKNPNSDVFVDMADARITAEQRLMELQLEQMDKELKELRQKRIEYWSAPNQLSSRFHLPEHQQTVDILDLRKKRLQWTQTRSSLLKPHQCHHAQQLLEEDLRRLKDRMNTVECMGPLLLKFCSDHSERIARQKYAYLRRVSNHCRGSEALDKVSGLLRKRLDALDDEYAILKEDMLKMNQKLPVALKVIASSKTDPQSVASLEATSRSKNAPRLDDAEVQLAVSMPLEKSSLQIFLRWMVTEVRLHKKVSRFFAKFQWLVYSQRYDLLRKSKSLVSSGPGAAEGGDHLAQINSSLGVGSGNVRVPTMVTNAERLNSVLDKLKIHLKAYVELDTENAQQFSYTMKTLLSKLHVIQTADFTFPPYDTTLVGKYMPVPSFGDTEETNRNKTGGIISGIDKAQIETTFMKPAGWRKDLPFKPQLGISQKEQEAYLMGMRDSDLDHLLRAEAEAILEGDLEVVEKRLSEQILTHMDRAFAQTDSELGTGKALMGGVKSTSTSGNQGLPADRLAPLYQMRLLQTRQARRRLTGVLNYFRSIERRLCLDAFGFAFPGSKRADPSVRSERSERTIHEEVNKESSASLEHASQHTEGFFAKRHESLKSDPNLSVKSVEDVMAYESIQSRDDSYFVDSEDIIRVRDASGTQIIYDAVLEDVKTVQDRMMRIGQHYLKLFETKFKEKGVPDRVSLLEDLYQSEATYYESLKLVVDVYLESYDHCVDRDSQRRMAQTIVDVMARRPLLDLELPYMVESYSNETVAVQMEASLLREMLIAQMGEERLYRNTIAARSSSRPKDRLHGFPPELFQPVTHEHLLCDLGTIFPTPGSYGVAILDLYSSLDSLLGFNDVLNAVVNEMVFVHKLKPGSSTAAMRTAILQQGLIEWRLLLEEEDLAEEIRKKSAGPGNRPYANSFVIDDPFAVEEIIDDVVLGRRKETESSAKKKEPVKKPDPKRAVVPEERLLFEEDAHENPQLQVHLDAIEAVILRKKLLDYSYETEILQLAYKGQAETYGKEAGRQPPPLDFAHPSDVSGGSRMRAPPDEVSSMGADSVTHLAIAEFDTSLAMFDFQTYEGIKEILNLGGVFSLRQALRFQALELGTLVVAMEYNQTCLDRCMESVILKEDALMGSSSSISFSGGGGAHKAFVPLNAPTAKKKQDAAEIAERNAKIAQEVQKFKKEEMGKIGDHFLQVRELKNHRRENILERFNHKSASIPSSGPNAKNLVRSLKYELLEEYLKSLLSDLEVFSVKPLISRIAEMLYRQAIRLPKPRLLFSQSVDPQASTITQARPLEVADESGKDMSIFASDLSLVSLWRIPHPIEVLDELPKEPRTLSSYLLCLWALHNLISIMSAYARALPVPLVSTRDSMVGYEKVQAFLGQVKSNIDGLPDSSRIFEVSSFLSLLQELVLGKYLLSLQALHHKLLANPELLCHVPVVKSAMQELEQRLYPPPATFPVSFPQVEAPPSSQRTDPGPFLYSPIPEPYSEAGLPLTSLAESERTLLKSEWEKLEATLLDTMQQRGIFLATAPLQAVQVQNEVVRTTLELNRMRNELGRLYLRMEEPRDKTELKEWTRIYEEKVLKRLAQAKIRAERTQADHQAAVLISGDANTTSAKAKVAEKAVLDAEMLSSELSQRIFLVRTLHDECCKFFLNLEMTATMKRHAAAMAAIDEMALAGPKGSGRKESVREPLSVTEGREEQGKVEMLVEFLKAVRSCAREEKESARGGMVLILSKEGFYNLVDVLASRLRSWNETRTQEAVRSIEMENVNLKHLLFLQERNIQYKEALREREQQSMARRIDVAVKDQCYSLLFKIDMLERKLEESNKNLAEMEKNVRERLKVEFEDLVKDLGTQLTMVRSQFKEYRESLQQDMKSNLHDIKKEAMIKFAKTGSAPIELKRMTLKMAHTEDTIEDLTIENSELKRALLKVRTMNSVKDLSIRMGYDKKLQALQTEKLEASRELYQDRAETQKQMEIMQTRLQETNLALAAAEAERDKLRKELDLANRNKQSLLTWKVAKSQQLADLEAKVKKYEKWSNHDVDKLLLDIERKESELKSLHSHDPTDIARHRAMLDANSRKEVEKLRKQLVQEQRLKLEAFQKLDELRNDFRWEEYFESVDDKQSVVSYWKRRFLECSSSLHKSVEENERLMEAMAAAGLDLPEEVKQSRTNSAVHPVPNLPPPPPTLGSSSSFRPQSAPVVRPVSGKVIKSRRPLSGAVLPGTDIISSVLHETQAIDERASLNPVISTKKLSLPSAGSRPGTSQGSKSGASPSGLLPRAAGGGGFYVRRPTGTRGS